MRKIKELKGLSKGHCLSGARRLSGSLALVLMLVLGTLCGCANTAGQSANAPDEASQDAAEGSGASDSDGAGSDASGNGTDGAGGSGTDTSAVAGADEMTTVESVLEEGMEAVEAGELVPGTYPVEMKSSSSMFKADHVELVVEEGSMQAILYMTSKSYLYLYPGTGAEAAAAEEADFIPLAAQSDEMGTFTLPVSALDAEVPCAAFSKRKEKWYDRTLLFRADSLPDEAFKNGRKAAGTQLDLAAGSYTVDVELSGGSGRASVTSPAVLSVDADGKMTARIEWSSNKYDFMEVGGKRYDPVNTSGNSVFEIPVSGFDYPMPVKADTTAMSKPYLIEYTLRFDSGSIKSQGKTSYATQFSVEERKDGVYLIHITGDQQFALVPEGTKVPSDLDSGIQVLRQPCTSLYLASSSAMDLFLQAGAIGSVSMTSTESRNWTIPEISERVREDEILYVGKYSAPDFEVILDEGCGLAIENTMIYHRPQIKEQLEKLGIPVLVEYSSYEKHPLGRLEWIRLYGLLCGKEQEADAFFEKARKQFERISNKAGARQKKEKKSVAVFSVSAAGYANVRRKDDYIPELIRQAGGRYLYPGEPDTEEDAGSPDAKEETQQAQQTKASQNLDLETFYQGAKDADILVYNGTIEGELERLSDLIEKAAFFKEFAAVKTGNVYCMRQSLFQKSSAVVDVMRDFQAILSGGEVQEQKLRYLKKLE